MSRLTRKQLLGFVLLLVIAPAAHALDPKLSPLQYQHTSWTEEEGIALPAVTSLAQTADGYLWLATAEGLMRFDGLRFTRFQPASGSSLPGSNAPYLLPSSDGSLWVANENRVSRIERGRVVPYAVNQPSDGVVRRIFEDRLGRLWIVRAKAKAESNLTMLLRDRSLRAYGPKDGVPRDEITRVYQDSRGDLWLGTVRSLCRWSPGSPAACIPGPDIYVASIKEAGGDLLVLDANSNTLLRLCQGRLLPLLAKPANETLVPKALFCDREGSIWIGTMGQGLVRLTDGKLERFTKASGLSSDGVNALLEDREGNLWAATTRGVDCFRDPRVVRLSTTDGLSADVITAIHAAGDGAVWAGTSGGLNRVAGHQVTSYRLNIGLPSPILSLYEDPAQRLWVGTESRFGYFWNGRFTEVQTTEHRPLNRVMAITGGRNGSVWFLDIGKGLMSVRHGVGYPAALAVQPNKHIYRLREDREGTLWIGYNEGGTTAIQGTAARNYGEADGLASGPIQDITEDRAGSIWIGAGGGLSRYRNGRWTTWGAGQGVPQGGVTTIVFDDRGDLWASTLLGLARLPSAEWNQSPDGVPHQLTFSLYGQSAGIRLAASRRITGPRGTKSRDGRLWFCTEDGIAVVDPDRLRTDSVPPGVVIEQMIADGRTVDVAGGPIGVQAGRLQFTYTGISLTAGERVRFRYRLEGLSTDWEDVGARRTVDYVNLPPKRYRFQVIAGISDGVWNQKGAALEFRILPHFYQTLWFQFVCGAALLAGVWAGHRIRVQTVVARVQLVARERTRLTRELHDSLLQGFVAVVYQLEAVARQFESHPKAARDRLQRAIERADQSLQEARHAMLAMRLPALEHSTLPEALSNIARRLTDGTHILFHLDVRGRVRTLPYDAQANLYLIGREAISNSVNHAKPSRIDAGLTYSSTELRLMVRDDGEGFDLAVAAAKHDHWGMAGMRERATQIGATLTVNSSPGHGTTIEVVVPAKHVNGDRG